MAQAIRGFMDRSQCRSLVDKATTSDEQATPGYLYNELAKLTFTSVSHCQIIQDHLLKRLEKDDPRVKFKTLRCLKHLVLKGHHSFRRDLQRQVEVLRDCLHCRGPPDPLRGDAPYRAIREEAQEIMNVLFSEHNIQENKDVQQQAPPKPSEFAVSMGSENISLGSGKRPMAGMGNFEPGNQGTSAGGLITSAWNTLSSIKKKFVTSSDSTSFQQYMTPSSDQNLRSDYRSSNFGSIDAASAFQPAAETPGASFNRRPGQVGGTWGMSNDYESPRFTDYSPASTSTKSEPFTRPPRGELSSIARSSQSSGTAEEKLVDDITAIGGVRVAPSRELLHQFCMRVEALDAGIIMELLEEKLGHSKWQVKLKALYVIEALLNSKNEAAMEFFAESGAVEELMSSSQKSISEKASKILRIVDFTDEQHPTENSNLASQPNIDQAQSAAANPSITRADESKPEQESVSGNNFSADTPPRNQPKRKPRRGKPTRPKPQHLNNEPGPASNLFDGLDVASSGQTSAEPPKSEPTPPKSLLIDFDDPQMENGQTEKADPDAVLESSEPADSSPPETPIVSENKELSSVEKELLDLDLSSAGSGKAVPISKKTYATTLPTYPYPTGAYAHAPQVPMVMPMYTPAMMHPQYPPVAPPPGVPPLESASSSSSNKAAEFDFLATQKGDSFAFVQDEITRHKPLSS